VRVLSDERRLPWLFNVTSGDGAWSDEGDVLLWVYAVEDDAVENDWLPVEVVEADGGAELDPPKAMRVSSCNCCTRVARWW
jgi:hypothetical protein